MPPAGNQSENCSTSFARASGAFVRARFGPCVSFCQRDENAMPRHVAHPTDQHVGTKLRPRRTKLGMSQSTLAEALGLTFQQVQKYEKGANRIGASRLQQIAQILHMPVEYFFEGMPLRHSCKSQTQSFGGPSSTLSSNSPTPKTSDHKRLNSTLRVLDGYGLRGKSHGMMRRPTRSEPIAVLGKRRIPLPLQNLHHRLLDKAIQYGWDAKLSHPTSPSALSAIPASKSTIRGSSAYARFSSMAAPMSVAGLPIKSTRPSSPPSISPIKVTVSINSAMTCANSGVTDSSSVTDPATPTVSARRMFRSRCCFYSSTNVCADHSPTAASTTSPSPPSPIWLKNPASE
jgi:DNA-binding XRE family transcriptional regulator